VLGEVLPDVLQSMAMLAGLYCDVGGTRKPLEMGEDAWKLGMEVLGPEHERLHRIQFTLARSYYAQGKMLLGAHHAGTLWALNLLERSQWTAVWV
jgi:hypothetical protein